MLQASAARTGLEALGIQIPEKFELIHNTDGDDPPDLRAFGLGFECTEFPPNQSAIRTVHQERAHQGMAVPGFSRTGGNVSRIRRYADSPGHRFCSVSEEISALENAFVSVITGPRSKDVSGNDVLLLDQRQDDWPNMATDAIHRVLQRLSLQYVRLIFLVRWTGWQSSADGVRPPEPCVIQMYP
jgi:hypothetical protein